MTSEVFRHGVLLGLILLSGFSSHIGGTCAKAHVREAMACERVCRRVRKRKFRELHNDMDALAAELAADILTNPDNVQGREELWMQRENLRGLRDSLWTWAGGRA